MVSPIGSNRSSPDIPLATPAATAPQPVPSPAPPAAPASSELPPSTTPPQRRLPPSALRLPARLTFTIKPQPRSLEAFATALKEQRQSVDEQAREQAAFTAYARDTGYGYLQLPEASHLPSHMDLDALDATIKELAKRISDSSHPEGIDMEHAPPRADFPCKLSFAVPFKPALLGQGQATASFSLSGELGLITFRSEVTDSISFDGNTIAPCQPPAYPGSSGDAAPHAGSGADKGKGKQRADTPADDFSGNDPASSRERTGSPAPQIAHDAEFAAALQAKEWERATAMQASGAQSGQAEGPAPASARSSSPAAGPSAGSMHAVPASYAEIRPHSYARDVLEALPEDGKTAYGLFAVLNAAKYNRKEGQTMEQAVHAYLHTFNGKTAKEKNETIDALCKGMSNKLLSDSFAVLNSRAKRYLMKFDADDLLKDFATTAAKIHDAMSATHSTATKIQTSLAALTRLAFPPAPFLRDYIEVAGKVGKEQLEAAFFIDVNLSRRADISPRDLLASKDEVQVARLVLDLRAGTSNNKVKGMLLEWRRNRHPLPMDQVLKNAFAEAYPPKNAIRRVATLAITLPMYQVMKGLTDAQLIKQLQDGSIVNQNLADILDTKLANLERTYNVPLKRIAATNAIKNHLAKLQAATENPLGEPGEPGETAAVTGAPSRRPTPGSDVQPPAKKRRRL